VILAMERNEATATAVATAYSLATTFKRTLLVIHARTAAEASAFLNPARPRWKSLASRRVESFRYAAWLRTATRLMRWRKPLRNFIPASL